MPTPAPIVASDVANKLLELGAQIRARRKQLRINATVAAEAAGMSRVTFFRIEKGEPSVTMGAYLNAMKALNMEFGIIPPVQASVGKSGIGREGWIPARIRIADYPQLKQLAWQVHGVEELTPPEALDIYERNWRHVDVQALEPHEKQLIEALRLALGEPGKNV